MIGLISNKNLTELNLTDNFEKSLRIAMFGLFLLLYYLLQLSSDTKKNTKRASINELVLQGLIQDVLI